MEHNPCELDTTGLYVAGSADADSEDVSILYRGQQDKWFELQFLHWNEARDYALI